MMKANPIRILIVDDHLVVRMGLRSMIDTQPAGAKQTRALKTPTPVVRSCALRPGTGRGPAAKVQARNASDRDWATPRSSPHCFVVGRGTTKRAPEPQALH